MERESGMTYSQHVTRRKKRVHSPSRIMQCTYWGRSHLKRDVSMSDKLCKNSLSYYYRSEGNRQRGPESMLGSRQDRKIEAMKTEA